MKRSGAIGWVPVVVALGCNARLIADDSPRRSNTDAGAMDASIEPASSASGGSNKQAETSGGSAGMRAAGGAGGIRGFGGAGDGGPGGQSGSGGGHVDAGDAAIDHGPHPHCWSMPPTCGPSGDSDCCASTLVPGGPYDRDGRVTPWDPAVLDMGDPPDGGRGAGEVIHANISDFRLDVYEVTVGRFRIFVDDLDHHELPARSGRNPNNRRDTGWLWEWNDSYLALLADRTKLKHDLNCNGQGTWADYPMGNESLPINCLTWFEAYAFCIWDEGRLPSEAEWHYAAEGASENRQYPWSNPPTNASIDDTYAVYDQSDFMGVVGSRAPKGNGKWGHADLAGNVQEWLRDQVWQTYEMGYYPAECDDCIVGGDMYVLTNPFQVAGGGFLSGSDSLLAKTRTSNGAEARRPDLGVRCARSAK